MLCDTKYATLTKLDRHMELAHTGNGGLAELLRVSIVEGSLVPQEAGPPVITPAVTAPASTQSYKREVQYINKSPNAIAGFLKDADNMIKAVKMDSIVQVNNKLSSLVDKLANEFSMFTTAGIVKSTRWSEMVRILEKILECDANAFPTLKVVARASSKIQDVFDQNSAMCVSRRQLKTWVKKALERVSDLRTSEGWQGW